ncbi:MAG: hypothetical protein EZS28_050152, partial [Streblomastix strix]
KNIEGETLGDSFEGQEQPQINQKKHRKKKKASGVENEGQGDYENKQLDDGEQQGGEEEEQEGDEQDEVDLEQDISAGEEESIELGSQGEEQQQKQDQEVQGEQQAPVEEKPEERIRVQVSPVPIPNGDPDIPIVALFTDALLSCEAHTSYHALNALAFLCELPVGKRAVLRMLKAKNANVDLIHSILKRVGRGARHL